MFYHVLFSYYTHHLQNRKEILPLLSNDFIQINQSVIINITKIKKVISSLNQTYTVYLDNNKKYTVTRSYFKLFNERIVI